MNDKVIVKDVRKGENFDYVVAIAGVALNKFDLVCLIDYTLEDRFFRMAYPFVPELHWFFSCSGIAAKEAEAMSPVAVIVSGDIKGDTIDSPVYYIKENYMQQNRWQRVLKKMQTLPGDQIGIHHQFNTQNGFHTVYWKVAPHIVGEARTYNDALTHLHSKRNDVITYLYEHWRLADDSE